MIMKRYLTLILCVAFFSWLAAGESKLKRINVARSAKAAADAPFSLRSNPVPDRYFPALAIDGNRDAGSSRWVSEQSKKPHWLTLTFSQPQTISEAIIYPDYEPGEYGDGFLLQFFHDDKWYPVNNPRVTTGPNRIQVNFDSVTTDKIRYYAQKADRDHYVKLFEFEVYSIVSDDGYRPMTYQEVTSTLGKLSRLKILELRDDWTISADPDAPGVPVRIGVPLNRQQGNFPTQPEVFYHCRFDLPEDFAKQNILIDLGKISADDEVRVNGIVIGGYGRLVPPFKPVSGSSGVIRRYLVQKSSSPFKPGGNHITVRVNRGFRQGMYEGIPTLAVVPESTPLVTLQLKRPGSNGLIHMICDRKHLDIFDVKVPFGLAPRVTVSGADFRGSLNISVDGGAEQVFPVAANHGRWQEIEMIPLLYRLPGHHSVCLTLQQNQKILWSKKYEFTVRAQAYTPSIPVDPAIPAVELNQSNDIARIALGSFGPRFVKNGNLSENLQLADGRGSLSFTSLCENGSIGPLLYSTNIRPTPNSPWAASRYLTADGKYYDGINDVWSWGFISDGSGTSAVVDVTESKWDGKSWRFRYPNGGHIDFRITNLSPAWELNASTSRIHLFEHLQHWGLGTPTRLAWEEKGQIKIGRDITSDAMSANWILAWFNNAEGWTEFDSPWLLILEKQPRSVKLDERALSLEFTGPAGKIRGMPLFGVELLPPMRTAQWAAKLPEEIVERCRYWSRALPGAPRSVKRAFSVDFTKDRVLVHDRFSYDDLSDDAWQTVPRRFAPVPPVYPLAAASGNLKFSIHAKSVDPRFSTLHGPLMLIDNAEEARYQIDGLLHLVTEVRQVQPSGKESSHLQALISLVQSKLPELRKHPWPMLTSHARFIIPGAYQPDVSNLLLTLPYLPEDLARQLKYELQSEMEKYLIARNLPGTEFQGKIRTGVSERPMLSFIKNPLTGLELPDCSLPNYNTVGIDRPCWDSLRLHLLWHYDYSTNSDLANRHWPEVRRIFNLMPNSHDWATSIIWDSYSGIRVGNGLQEGGIIHAGCVAMARMAQLRGETTLRDLASYLAVSQLIGVQASLSANDYLRSRRPFSASHTQVEDIIFTEKSRNGHYVEFNEFAGFSPNVIMARGLLNHPNSFIMTTLPEIMRPYQVVWADASNEFFTPPYQYSGFNLFNGTVKVDMGLYMLNNTPMEILMKLHSLRQKLPWTEQLADLRALLDAEGKIHYQKLW